MFTVELDVMSFYRLFGRRRKQRDMTMPPEIEDKSDMKADGGRQTDGIATTMLPPESRPSRRRKGTPHPKRVSLINEEWIGKRRWRQVGGGGSFRTYAEATCIRAVGMGEDCPLLGIKHSAPCTTCLAALSASPLLIRRVT